jgi:hypothetical protein
VFRSGGTLYRLYRARVDVGEISNQHSAKCDFCHLSRRLTSGLDTDDTNFVNGDICAIRTALRVRPIGREPAMTKTISIYGAQVLLGIVAIAAGYAKVSGASFMVEPFQMLGLGDGFLFAAGCAEIAAGFCLLLPRGGILGAVLLACVMVGTLGGTIGHVAGSIAMQNDPAQHSISLHGAQSRDGGVVFTIGTRQAMDI